MKQFTTYYVFALIEILGYRQFDLRHCLIILKQDGKLIGEIIAFYILLDFARVLTEKRQLN